MRSIGRDSEVLKRERREASSPRVDNRQTADALEVLAVAGGGRQFVGQCGRGDLAVLRGNGMPAAGAFRDEQRDAQQNLGASNGADEIRRTLL